MDAVQNVFGSLKCAQSLMMSQCLSSTLHRRSKLIFKNADKEDFGTYSVSVTSTEGVSSSYTISAEGRIVPSLCECGTGALIPSQTLSFKMYKNPMLSSVIYNLN